MVETALTILTGTILYAGAHHLYLGATRTSTQPHLQLAAMYLLLAGFVLASAAVYQSQENSAPVYMTKLAMTMAILLWVALIWYVAFYTRSKPLLLLDLLTAAWIIFLIRNMGSPHGLLYADITPIDGTPFSAQGLSALTASTNSWWAAVKFTMLASFLFCFYASLQMFRRGNKQAALALVSGLSILAAASLADHLFNTRAIQTLSLAPFGFIGFLLANSLHPILQEYQSRRKASQAPVIYSLTFDPERTSFDSRLSDLQSSSGEDPEQAAATATFLPDDKVNCAARQGESPAGERGCPGVQGESPAGERGCPGVQGESPLGEREPPGGEGTLGQKATVDIAVIDPGTKAGRMDSRGETATETPWRAPPTPMAKRGQSSPNIVSDNLIAIAVYATIALNRFKRGDADLEILETLCGKIRTKAIKTRRLANKLSRPN